MASAEPAMNAFIWSRYCRAEARVPASALSRREECSSRKATACNRGWEASVTTSCTPSSIARSRSASVSDSLTRIAGTCVA